MTSSQNKSKGQSGLSRDLESIVKKIENHKGDQVTVKSITGIKNAILNKKKTWITIDGNNWVFVELRKDGKVWVNYGLDEQETTFKIAIKNIYDFLTFKRSTDLL